MAASEVKWAFPMKPPSKPTIVIAATLLLVAILLPQVVSAAWHLAHGRSVSYRSWQITVPFGWYAASHGEILSVERMSEIPWQQHPSVEFQPVHFSKTFPFSYDLFGKEQALTLRSSGYLLSGRRDVTVAGKEGRCWIFDNSKNRNRIWIACIVPKDLTSTDFIGNKSYANDFFALLAESKRNPAAKD